MHPAATPDSEVAAELAALRPGLLSGYAAELSGARAAVLTRLWRALVHEPLPWVERREHGRGEAALLLRDGRRLTGPERDPYRTDDAVASVALDGSEHTDPARLLRDLAVPGSAGLADELAHSVASLALSRAAGRARAAATPDLRRPDAWPSSDWEWERRVVDGHPFHPNCRFRPGFSVAEELAYGPEHGPVVPLGLVPVPADDCLVVGDWPERLRESGRLLLPVHPWQDAHVLPRPGVAKALPGPAAHPLMSLRTLAVPDGPHVKTALSTRLTSAVRDISVESVAASSVLSSFGERLAARADGLLHTSRTLAAATAHSPDLAAVLRDSPRSHAAPGEHVVPVAVLRGTGLPDSPQWLAEFVRLAVTVGLRLLETGVALEAHGQNLLVVLSPDGRPRRLVYRDLADMRISPERLARHGIAVPDLPARMLTDDPAVLRRKLFGSLVGGALAQTAGSVEALRAALAPAVGDLPRTPDLAALCGDPLPVKALTLMRLSGRPGDRWARLPNPLRA
ncbi:MULTISPECIES: IucA/IucC family protein [unclassified Streptomyces]|uniref:IucA/IucC family protein n=1 Tax=unclassified Streptomyces TaxID=2593676 RepID=UPI001907931F|nr:IucA/IucC family protein [Streptomyces sp. HSG2]